MFDQPSRKGRLRVATALLVLVLLAAAPAALAGSSSPNPGASHWFTGHVASWISSWFGNSSSHATDGSSEAEELGSLTAAQTSGELDPPPSDEGWMPCVGFCTTGGSSSDPDG